MSKVAKLVEFSLLVRVIVEEDANDDAIIATAYDKVQDKIDNRELGDNLVSIEDDVEVPFGEAPNDSDENDGITSKMVKEAAHYLSDGDIDTREMVRRIMDYEDQSEQIDYVDGVVVWFPCENTFSCSAFIELIS